MRTRSMRRSATRLGPLGGNQGGFTLMELIIAAALTALLIMGVLSLFDSTNAMATAQLDRATMQQNQRATQRSLTRLSRMVGRGGLMPSSENRPLPQGFALEVINDVPPGTKVADNNQALVAAGSDMLVVRGVFATPIYQVNYVDRTLFDYDEVAGTGEIRIDDISPAGVAHDLDPLEEMRKTSGTVLPEGLILGSPFDEETFAVMKVTDIDVNSDHVIVDFAFDTDYTKLSSTGDFFPLVLDESQVAFVGILEEYHFYVREIPVDTADPAGPKRYTLTRARVYPGTTTPYEGDAQNLLVDISDNVIDFQVSLGFDTAAGAGVFAESGEITESVDGQDDDWLYNYPDEETDDPNWATILASRDTELYYIRLSTLVETQNIIRGHSRPIEGLEDRAYGDTFLAGNAHLRTLLTSTIDMRNLG